MFMEWLSFQVVVIQGFLICGIFLESQKVTSHFVVIGRYSFEILTRYEFL